MNLLVLGVTPPTDIERRTRDLQRELYRQAGLLGGMALPVLIPLEVREEVGVKPMRSRPEGRLESARMITGAFASQGQWLVWMLRPDADVLSPPFLSGLWAEASKQAGGPAWAATPLPTAAGLLLGCCASPRRLEQSRLLLGSESPRTFQPHSLALYRIRISAIEAAPPGEPDSPAPSQTRVDGAEGETPFDIDWEEVLAAGVFWEELWRVPLRRPR